MENKTIAIILALLLFMPMAASANYLTENHSGILGILTLLEQKLEALQQLFGLLQQSSRNDALASVIKEVPSISGIRSNNCNNYDKICPVSPFGTRKDPPPFPVTSTVPEFTIKYVDANGPMATVDYSVSGIGDNQTMYWLDYGTSSSSLNSTTSPVNVSYGIANRHGLDDGNFLIVDSSACLYASSTKEQFLLYNPNSPTYYFRFEEKNNLGNFFSPSLDSPPLSFSFDPYCGDNLQYYQ